MVQDTGDAHRDVDAVRCGDDRAVHAAPFQHGDRLRAAHLDAVLDDLQLELLSVVEILVARELEVVDDMFGIGLTVCPQPTFGL